MDKRQIYRFSISLLFLAQVIGFSIYIFRLFVEPIELSIGVHNTISIWIGISLIPILIPLVTEIRLLKLITLIFCHFDNID
jgi:hypothetical protein